MNRREALDLVVATCTAAGWAAVPVPGEKAVRATYDGREIELRVSVLGPNSRGQWLKRTMPIGPAMYACPIIDGQVYLVATEEWRTPNDVLGTPSIRPGPRSPSGR